MSGGDATTGNSGVSVVEERFTNARKKLDQLGYRQPLTVEALSLTERLLADLIWTTEHLRKAKQETEKRVEVKSKIEEYIEPYKSDNGKLVKENNELHQELLRLKQRYEEENRELQAAKRRLESEVQDLRFLNSQCLAKLKQLEEESRRKSERMLQLQEKNLQAVVQTPSGKKKSIPYRRQRMEVDELLEPSAPSTARSQPGSGSSRRAAPLPGVRRQQQDPHVVDLVKAAQKRIAELQRQLERQAEEADIQERRIANLKRAASLREDEISRLKALCEGGRPYEAVSLEAEARGAERLLQQQAAQIDALTARNRDLEAALEAAQARLGAERRTELNLDARNRHLSGELASVGRQATKLEAEKAEALAAADAEIAEARGQLEATRQRLTQLEEACAQLEEERQQLQESLTTSKRAADASSVDNRNLHELTLRLQADKKRLAQRVEKLTANERELVLEIERLKRKVGQDTNNNSSNSQHGKTKKAAAPATTSRLEQYLKGVESDRDYWKREADQLAAMLRTPALVRASSGSGVVRGGSRSPSPAAGGPGRLGRSPSAAKLRGSQQNGLNGKQVDYTSDHGGSFETLPMRQQHSQQRRGRSRFALHSSTTTAAAVSKRYGSLPQSCFC